jgi:radical SAM superfamily enzyme YgiQ (UPF0313 family)
LALSIDPSIIGIYSMFSLSASTFRLAGLLKDDCDLLVAGGPLPTLFPEDYLKAFDVVCIGEGEETMLELAQVTEIIVGRQALFPRPREGLA